MSHVDFKKCLCHPVELRVKGHPGACAWTGRGLIPVIGTCPTDWAQSEARRGRRPSRRGGRGKDARRFTRVKGSAGRRGRYPGRAAF